MTIQRLAALVSTTLLKTQLLQSPRLVLLDTSWMPEPDVDGRKEFYNKGHIKGAHYFDLKKISSKRPDCPIDCPVPDIRTFREYAESLGINRESQVVVYDSLNSRPSVRTWYLLRLFGHDNVSMLNGGMAQWQREGNEVTQEIPNPPEKSTIDVEFREHLLVDLKTMRGIVETQSHQIVDTRPGVGGFYISEEDKSGGHMPGAKNIPFPNFFNKDGTFKSESALAEMMSSAGVDLTRPSVATCQRGMTACAMAMAAYILGNNAVPVYNGSWMEWSVLADPQYMVKKRISN